MALPATHLRFACDLESSLSIRDQEAYYTGSLYPDSRYFTGIPRDASHGDRCPHNPFVDGLSDFERGWATHLLYDETVGREQQAIIPVSYPRTKEFGGFDDWWVYLTALKTVEDIQSAELQIVRDVCRLVKNEQNPNQESPLDLRHYYTVVRDTYEQIPSFVEYKALMSRLAVPLERVDVWIETVQSLLQNKSLQEQIAEMYPRQLKKTLKR